MNPIRAAVQTKLTELAEEAADAVFTVSRHERAGVACNFVVTFRKGVEARETREQVREMEGEGCPNRPAD